MDRELKLTRPHTLRQARSESAGSVSPLGYLLWSVIAGLMVPVLIVIVGVITVLLDDRGLTNTDLRLGSHLIVPLPGAIGEREGLLQLTILVAIAFSATAFLSLAVWLQRRVADHRARAIVKDLHRQLLRQSGRRAELEGAAAQQVRAEELIGRRLPQLQSGLSMWYRAVPRSVLTLLGCVTLAIAVNVWLALTAVLTGCILWRFSRRLRSNDESELAGWEVPRSRQRMAELVGRAPLMTRLQTPGLTEQTFDSELETLYRKLEGEDARVGRIWPMLFVAISAAVSIMVLGLGTNLFGVDAAQENGLSLPAALVLVLSLGGALIAFQRLYRTLQQTTAAGEASDAVYGYLRRGNDAAPSENRVGLAGLRDSVDIQDVTLHGSTGHPILSHLTARLTPKSLVALLGTDSVSTRAMMELLMGFGMPEGGRVAIDGLPLRDIHPNALAKAVMYIEPEGPLWEGTVVDNIRGGDDSISGSAIAQTLRDLDVYERLMRYPDGLDQIVSADEDALGTEVTYAIGVARAVLHRPPIVLASEPPPPPEGVSDDPCLQALRGLAEQGSLVLMMPRRLSSLRHADRVLLLNGSQLAGEGTHNELLKESDLYRHINYLLFNPYRRKVV